MGLNISMNEKLPCIIELKINKMFIDNININKINIFLFNLNFINEINAINIANNSCIP